MSLTVTREVMWTAHDDDGQWSPSLCYLCDRRLPVLAGTDCRRVPLPPPLDPIYLTSSLSHSSQSLRH